MMKTFLVVLFIEFCLANIGDSQTCPNEPLCVCKYIPTAGFNGVNCSSSGISSIPTGIPDDRRLYDFRVNKISSLSIHTFTRISKTFYLFLQSNLLTTISKDMFRPLSALIYLNIGYNKIRQLTEDVFESIPKLQVLIMNGNKLESLPVGIFKTHQTLRQLSIAGNPIQIIEVGIFDNNPQMQQIKMSSTLINNLDGTLFKNLKLMQYLEVSTRLPSLPVQLLEDMNPTTLVFGDNLLQKLPDGFFKGQTRLITLQLGNNQLNSLQENSFEDLFSLQILGLSKNSLTSIPSRIFQSLRNLHTLFLDYNSLSDLDPDLFTSLTKLHFLLLNNNRIETFRAGVFDKLVSLTVLFASSNRIVSIPDPELLFKYNTKMLLYNLQKNQMICDCSAKNVYFFAKRVLAENKCNLVADCSHVSGKKVSLCGLKKSFFEGCVDVTNNTTSSESTTTLFHKTKKLTAETPELTPDHEEEHDSETDVTRDTTSANINTTKTTDETAEHDEENESETGFTATATFAAAGVAASTLAVYGLSKTLLKRISTSSVSPDKGFGGDNSDREETFKKNKSATNTAKMEQTKNKRVTIICQYQGMMMRIKNVVDIMNKAQ